MNSQQLHCFLCVADKLNFTKAAEELFLSTPTVTHHIKALEEELHTQLFFRNSKVVQLTEAGTVFYNDAKEIIAKMDIAQKNLQTLAQTNITFLLDRMVSVLSGIQKQYPCIHPKIFLQDYFTLKTLFENKQIDLMIATKEMIQDMKNCIFTKIKSMHSYALVPVSHPLRDRTHVSFHTLTDECLITLHPKVIPYQYGNTLQENIRAYTQNHIHMTAESDSLSGLTPIPIDEGEPIDYGIAAWEKSPLNRYFIRHYAQ